MGMNAHYSVVLGVKIPRNYFPGVTWEDDFYLPYVEGHPGVEMSIIKGEGNDNIYLGKTLVRIDPYEDFEDKSLEFSQSDRNRVSEWLKETFGIDEMPRLMLVCVWL